MFMQYSIFFSFVLLPEFFFILLLLLCFCSGKSHFDPVLLALVVLLFLYLIAGSLYKYYTTAYVDFNLSVTTLMRFLFYFMITIFLSANYFLREYGAKTAVYLAGFNSIYGVIQFVSFKAAGLVLPWYLPLLSVQQGQRLIAEQDFIFGEFGYRLSGLFSEPAHFCQFIGFALLIVLFYKKGGLFARKVQVLFVVIFILSLLLSGSGTGVFVIIFIFTAFCLKLIFGKYSAKNFVLSFSFLVVSAFSLIIVILLNDALSLGVLRVLSFSDMSTLNVRLIRPVMVFLSLDYVDTFFGVGYGNYSTYVFYNNINNIYESSIGSAWTNSLGVFLVGSGLLGFSLVSVIYRYIFINSDSFGRLIILYIFVHFFFSDLPHSIFFICFISFAFVDQRKFFRDQCLRGVV